MKTKKLEMIDIWELEKSYQMLDIEMNMFVWKDEISKGNYIFTADTANEILHLGIKEFGNKEYGLNDVERIYRILLVKYRKNIKHIKYYYDDEDERDEDIKYLEDGRKELHKMYKSFVKSKSNS